MERDGVEGIGRRGGAESRGGEEGMYISDLRLRIVGNTIATYSLWHGQVKRQAPLVTEHSKQDFFTDLHFVI